MTPDLQRERLRERLEAADQDPIPLAISLGRGRDYISDFLQGRKRSLHVAVWKELAQRLSCELDYFLDEQFDAPNGASNEALDGYQPTSNVVSLDELRDQIRRMQETSLSFRLARRPRTIERDIPVVGVVEAGVWREVQAAEHAEPEEWLPLDIQGYERATLTAYKVAGPSMNKHYPPGRYVVVAPAAEAGVRDGDHVIVERNRGGLVEITIKELKYEDGRVALWPRSTHEDYQQPVYVRSVLADGTSPRDQDAPRVVGVVVADYGKRQRPPAQFETMDPDKGWAE